MVQEGYLFKGTSLCIPTCGSRELLIREIHGSPLIGHFGESKTLTMLREHCFWPGISKDIQYILRRYATYQVAKSSPKAYTHLCWFPLSLGLK